MTASALVAAPKLNPPAGRPPMIPGSAVRVIRSDICSSFAILDTPSGMPIPRLMIRLPFSSNDVLRTTIFLALISMGGIDCIGTFVSQLNEGLYCTPKVCQ